MALINIEPVILNLVAGGKNYTYDAPTNSVLINNKTGKVTSFYIGNNLYVLGGGKKKQSAADFMIKQLDKVISSPKAMFVIGGRAGLTHKFSTALIGAFAGLTVAVIKNHLSDKSESQKEGYFHNGNRVYDPTYFTI